MNEVTTNDSCVRRAQLTGCSSGFSRGAPAEAGTPICQTRIGVAPARYQGGIMARHLWAASAGPLLGLLVVSVPVLADEAAAVKAIKDLGGKVTVDDKQPSKPVVGVNLQFTKVKDADLKVLKDLSALQTLSLLSTAVTDEGIKELKELESLRELDLRATSV